MNGFTFLKDCLFNKQQQQQYRTEILHDPQGQNIYYTALYIKILPTPTLKHIIGNQKTVTLLRILSREFQQY